MHIVHEIVSRLIIQHLGIGKFDVVPFKPLELCPEKFLFMQILAAFLIIVLPLAWELLFNIYR